MSDHICELIEERNSFLIKNIQLECRIKELEELEKEKVKTNERLEKLEFAVKEMLKLKIKYN